MDKLQDIIELEEADKLFKQMASYNYSLSLLLYKISKTKYKFSEQNYLNIVYGLDQSKITYFTLPVKDVDIMELFNRNMFRNIIFEYLDNYFGEYNRKFINMIVIPDTDQYAFMQVSSKESKNQIENALKEILPDHEEYIKIEIL